MEAAKKQNEKEIEISWEDQIIKDIKSLNSIKWRIKWVRVNGV